MTIKSSSVDSSAPIDALLRCPIEWEDFCPEWELCKWLNYAWYKTVEKHQSDRECHLFSTEDWAPCDFQLGMMDPDEVRSTRINIESWRVKAIETYKQQYRGLRELEVATASEYSKHYCRTTSSDEDVAELSVQKGQGILYPRITAEWQRIEAWATLLDVWITDGRDTINDHDLDGSEVIAAFESLFVRNGLTVAREFCEPIGCSAGQQTVYGFVKYDFTSSLVHMHPVSETEARAHAFFTSGWLRH